jgi:hypothetical protein
MTLRLQKFVEPNWLGSTYQLRDVENYFFLYLLQASEVSLQRLVFEGTVVID